MSDPEWLPPLLTLDSCQGDWNRYVNRVYGEFHYDFIQRQPQLRDCWVRCRRDPICQGKEAGFWHCISGGPSEAERVPQVRRMERVRWVRAVIEHEIDAQVQSWRSVRGSDHRFCLWFREEFLVVLAERVRQRDGFRYWQLITAYDTLTERRKAQLRREWREYHENANPPGNG